VLDIIEIHTVVVIGYPAYEPLPSYRRELKERVHFEKYDRSKFRSGEDIVRFLRDLRQRTKPGYAQEKSPEKPSKQGVLENSEQRGKIYQGRQFNLWEGDFH
jgi:hypothetical protein